MAIYDPAGISLHAYYGANSASYALSGSVGRSSEFNALRASQSLQEQIWCCTPCSSSQATQAAAAGHITSGSCPDCGKPDPHSYYGHVRQGCNCDCGCAEKTTRYELRWSGSDPSETR